MSPDAGAVTAANTDAPQQPQTEQFADVIGFIDSIGTTRISGWVWDRQNPAVKLKVDVRLDNQPVETVLADQPRHDLIKASVGDGAYGFEAVLPEKLSTADRHRVTAVVHMPGLGGEIRLKNQAAVNTEELTLRPSDYKALVEHLEQCVEDQRAGFRWIYQELHNLDEFVRNDARSIPTIAAAPETVTGGDVNTAIRTIENQFSEMVQNQAIIQDSLESMAEHHKSVNRRLEQLDIYHAKMDAHLKGLQRDREDIPEFKDGQRGLKRLVFLLACLTIASLSIGIRSLFT